MAACFYVFEKEAFEVTSSLENLLLGGFSRKTSFNGQKGLYMFETLKIFLYQDS